MLVIGCDEPTNQHGSRIERDKYGCFSDSECATGLVCASAMIPTVGEPVESVNATLSGYARTTTAVIKTRLDAIPTEIHLASVLCPMGSAACDPESGECTAIDGELCERHADCINGICMAGICRTVECVSDANCTQNQLCDEANRCVDVIVECLDPDGDGYGRGVECLGTNCDEGSAEVHSGVIEDGTTLCDDGIDNNCDGVDSPCVVTDGDGDGFPPEMGDCDDGDPTINHSRAETPYNHRDDDCNPETPDGDLDGDGWSSDRTYSREERLACRDVCKSLAPEAYAACVADPMIAFDPDQSEEALAQSIEEHCAERTEREEVRCIQTCRPDCDMNPQLNWG